MARNRKKRSQKKKQAEKNDNDIKISAGKSDPERYQHDEIEIEPRTRALKTGGILEYGEVISTPVRKLLECGAITHDEAHAASLFRYDHDAAFASCKSSLCSIAIDGGGPGDFTKQIFHAQRFKMAKSWLLHNVGSARKTSPMLQIAELAILGTESFSNLGSSFLPRASNQEHIPAGKAILALVIRELSCFYESLNESTSKGKRRRSTRNREDFKLVT